VQREPDPPERGGFRRYAANTAWLVVAEAAGKIASFAFVVIVARSLGTRDFGYFTFAISFVPLFLVFGGWGLASTVIREIARDRSRLSEVFATGIALRASLGLGGLALALASGPLFLHGGQAYGALAVVGTALLLDELSAFLGTVFRAFERMKFHALVVLTNRILSTALAIIAVSLGAGLVVVCATYLVGSLGAFVFGAIALRRYFPPIDFGQVRGSVARSLVRTGIPLGFAGVLNTAVFRIDTVLLQAIKGPVEVGLYGAAYRFFESLLFVAWSLGNAALPRMARERRGPEVGRTYELTAVLSLAFYLPVALTVPFSSDWLVTTLFSERYADASSIVGVLTGAAALYALAYTARMGGIALGRTKQIAVIAGVTLAANLAMNAIAIPRYGFEGAAWTTLATEALEAALLTAFFFRANGAFARLRPLLVPIVATAGLAALLVGASLEGPRALLAAALAYPPALLLSAALLAPDELRRLPAALRGTQEAGTR
jgi:O-antigen/teichoic acid export membrane protein